MQLEAINLSGKQWITITSTYRLPVREVAKLQKPHFAHYSTNMTYMAYMRLI